MVAYVKGSRWLVQRPFFTLHALGLQKILTLLTLGVVHQITHEINSSQKFLEIWQESARMQILSTILDLNDSSTTKPVIVDQANYQKQNKQRQTIAN